MPSFQWSLMNPFFGASHFTSRVFLENLHLSKGQDFPVNRFGLKQDTNRKVRTHSVRNEWVSKSAVPEKCTAQHSIQQNARTLAVSGDVLNAIALSWNWPNYWWKYTRYGCSFRPFWVFTNIRFGLELLLWYSSAIGGWRKTHNYWLAFTIKLSMALKGKLPSSPAVW